MLEKFLYYFLLFYIYSIIGWVLESTYVAIKEKKFVDRGFLVGPYCPIYGIGGIGIVIYLTQYKDNVLTVFILGLVICSVLEYFTSYIMEKLFKARWWDYSDKKYNLNGRICGSNSLLFGLISILVIYFVQPTLEKVLISFNPRLLLVLNIIALVIFCIDNIISFNVASKFRETVTSIDIKKDSTQEFAKLVKDTIRNNNKVLQKRLYMAFPDIDLNKLAKLKNEIEDDIKEFLNK